MVYIKVSKENCLSLIPEDAKNNANLSENAKIVFGFLLKYFDECSEKIKVYGSAHIKDNDFIEMLQHTFQNQIDKEFLYSALKELINEGCIEVFHVSYNFLEFDNLMGYYFIPKITERLEKNFKHFSSTSFDGILDKFGEPSDEEKIKNMKDTQSKIWQAIKMTK